MTREEATLAAATFEFPPFRAEAVEMFRCGNCPDDAYGVEWTLKVTRKPGEFSYFTVEEWLDYWAFHISLQAGRRGVPALGQNDDDEGSER